MNCDTLSIISSFLTAKDMTSFKLVSKEWKQVSTQHDLRCVEEVIRYLETQLSIKKRIGFHVEHITHYIEDPMSSLFCQYKSYKFKLDFDTLIPQFNIPEIAFFYNYCEQVPIEQNLVCHPAYYYYASIENLRYSNKNPSCSTLKTILQRLHVKGRSKYTTKSTMAKFLVNHLTNNPIHFIK